MDFSIILPFGLCTIYTLSSYMLQFLFHLLPTYLRIAYRGLNGRRPFLRDVPKVVGHFFERQPAFRARWAKSCRKSWKVRSAIYSHWSFVARALSVRNQK